MCNAVGEGSESSAGDESKEGGASILACVHTVGHIQGKAQEAWKRKWGWSWSWSWGKSEDVRKTHQTQMPRSQMRLPYQSLDRARGRESLSDQVKFSVEGLIERHVFSHHPK
jgi:hypothetical protein